MAHGRQGPGRFRELRVPFAEAVARLPEALKQEGFGVITEVDVRETLAAKLGVEFRPYRIFGACNPGYAHAALEHDLHVGVLLPCNVVLYEGDNKLAVAGVIDPMASLGAHDPELREVARAVAQKLDRVLDQLAA